MSNPSELGTGSTKALPTENPLPAPPPPRLWRWYLKQADAFLSEPIRRGPVLELNRARLQVSLSVIVLIIGALYLFFVVPEFEKPWLLGLVALLSLTGIASSLVMLHWMASPRIPALVQCICMAVPTVSVILQMGERGMALQASAMIIPLTSVYLLGVRKGLFLSLLLAVNAALIHPFLHTRSNPLGWAFGALTALTMLAVCLMSWLFARSRDEVLAALEQALKTQSESERKLSSLLENTEDVVCSIDLGGRIVTANRAFRHLYLQLHSREFRPGESLRELLPLEDPARWTERFQQVLGGHRVRFEVKLTVRGHARVLDVSLGPIAGERGMPEGMTLFGKDVTASKEAESRLGEMHRNLIDVSRQAGMAEIATGVIHNVGNTLNSASVSAELVIQGLRGLRVSSVVKTLELLREHAGHLDAFLSSAQGRQVPSYLEALGKELPTAKERLLEEMRALQESLENVKAVVLMQQEHARYLGVVEPVAVPQLIDDALRLQGRSFESLGIQVRREYGPVPLVMVDRHKLLQILLNLLNNARHALEDRERSNRRLTVRVSRTAQARLRIEVEDSGTGIAPEHLPRLFTQGFTTKKTGHGFGLHISALSARELGGSLSCTSPGPGQGATFTIEVPLET
ncbi:ATP-binding protein [Cystobacter ferrugineus]|uniref:histidine kinase n=1 Tax=Cystobacter ferrugineus TaxID=83449 RepID=A0A1L9B3G7_9BACT|nr:ATP-binding protein [Cystobacter ferrugineus]OJH36815.1 hypothetical protein BON30_30375 [Cystobacter ferrugineus]